MGTLSAIGNALDQIPEEVKAFLNMLDPGETKEDPDDMYHGERWAHETIEAVVRSPAWERTLLIYTYDEHGGYYDHVPPPKAIRPDDIPPAEPPGDYAMYGPRVPAVVVSPYSKAGGVSNLVCDHTSILATIEHKWNLPALTNRDANANTIMDAPSVAKVNVLGGMFPNCSSRAPRPRIGAAVTRWGEATARSSRARQWVAARFSLEHRPERDVKRRSKLCRACPPLDRLRRSQDAPSVQKVNVSRTMFPNWLIFDLSEIKASEPRHRQPPAN